MDVMVVPGPLDFNLLLGHDYTYAMGALFSSLFRVMCFLHQGQIVTIDQIAFFGPNMEAIPPPSLLNIYPPVVSSLPHVNYVATFPMSASTNNSVSEVVHNVLGALGPNFRDVVLPSDENLLEAISIYMS